MKTKVMAIFATLIVALSVAGIVYAHWTDSVQIEGTVHMGELIVGILDIKSIEDSDDLTKDPCDTTVTLDDPQMSVHHDPPQTVYHEMYVTVDNGYPQYWVKIKFDLKNAGTIPAHIIALTIVDIPGDEELVWQYDPLTDTWEGKDPITLDPIINLYIRKQSGAPLVCNQLEPCTDEPCDLWFELKQPAKECHTYDFKIHIEAIQWNKYVP